MSADEQIEKTSPKPDRPSLPSATAPAGAPTAGSEAKPVSQLTPEEQMALFEKELKETDWGHQPC